MPEEPNVPEAVRSPAPETTPEPQDLTAKRSRKARLCPAGMEPRAWRAQLAAERKEARERGLKKAHEMLRLKAQQRELVKKKVEMQLPITEQERELLTWSRTRSQKVKKQQLIDQVAKLVISPKTVEELRMVVEQTAARHAYNPIEALIRLGGDDSSLEDKDKVAIHKALLPFLVPQLPTPKAQPEKDGDSKRVRVTVTQFVFPERPQNNVTPLHKERPPSIVDTDPTPTHGNPTPSE